jgi:hypothetical protein
MGMIASRWYFLLDLLLAALAVMAFQRATHQAAFPFSLSGDRTLAVASGQDPWPSGRLVEVSGYPVSSLHEA